MNRRRSTALFAAAVAATLTLAACGGGSSSDEGSSSAGGEAAYNAAVKGVVNPSTKTGGVLKMAQSSDWDSVDPADTYWAYGWNFARLYGRSLTTYPPIAGDAGNNPVPDLATSLGKSSDGGKTWTYTLRDGVKFEDGTPVTSKDVAYAVSRSLDKDVLVNGPTYMNDWLDLKGYKGPYKDKGKPNPAIETPDDKTIIFHLKAPYSGFDNFAAQPNTMPVPEAKDTGNKYKQHVVSTGPYMFKTVDIGKQYVLVKNPNWDKATDPIRKQLVDEIDVAVNVNADDIDNRLIAGDLDVDLAGAGVQPAAQAKILPNPELKKEADTIPQARLNYVALHADVAPLDDVNCRKAILLGVDKTGIQRAYGGPVIGSIATNLMPPIIAGQQSFDLYQTPESKGDATKAKAALAECGQPNGFSANMAYRADRPKEKAVAESMQESLAKIGIKLSLKGYPSGDYSALYAGNTQFVKRSKMAMNTTAWGADWNDGFGMLSQMTDPRVIKPSGNTNYSVTDPEVGTLIDKAIQTADKTAREQAWVAVDKRVMEGAYILPGMWQNSLNFRSPNVTNVVAQANYGMYDYLNLGVLK